MTVEIAGGFTWISQLGGPAVEWANPKATYRHDVAGAGLEGWFAHDLGKHDEPKSLSKHIEEPQGTRMLRLGLHHGAASVVDPVSWESTLEVGDGRYVRASGNTSDFQSALAAAESHEHESRQIGGLTWWRESEGCWVAWVGSFRLRAMDLEERWLFESRGYAQNFEEAALLAVMAGRGER